MAGEYCHIFRKFGLCQGLCEDDCEEILMKLKPVVKRYRKGQVLFAEGSRQYCFGLVTVGEVMQSRIRPNGERVLFEVIKEGHLFGEIMMFLEPKPSWRCDTIAKTECEIVLFSVEAFFDKEFRESNASATVIFNLLRRVCDRYESLQVLLKCLKTQTIRQRVANYLYQRYSAAGATNFKLGMTRFELAELLNMPRPSLSRELSAMKAEGILSCVGDQFDIKDIEKLKKSM